ncbi:MAG: hypothetical protein KI786_19145, partial [Mameliella sp.]|nr:hypothetical protein [Phaeodactylibacter sp.]
RLDTLSRFPVQHAQFKGKDYILALSERDSLYIFDRMGALRLAPKPMRAKAVSPPFLQADDQQQRIAIGQADGYAQVFNLEGQTFRLSLAGEEIEEGQFLFEDIAEDGRSDYLLWNERAVQLFGYEGNTFNQIQNWTVDGVVSEVSTTKSKKESLLMAFSPSARRIWALSMDGQSLGGFPVAADRPGSTLNEDKQLWLLCYYEGSLYLYEL